MQLYRHRKQCTPCILIPSKDVIARMHQAAYDKLPKGKIVERQLEQFTARYLQGSLDDVLQKTENINGYTVQQTINPQTEEGLCTASRSGKIMITTHQDICLQYIELLAGRQRFTKRGVSSQGVIVAHNNMLPAVLQAAADELIGIQPTNKPLRWTFGTSGSKQVLTFLTDTSVTVPVVSTASSTTVSGATLTGETLQESAL